MEAARTDLAYWLALHRIPGVGPVKLRRLAEHFGDLSLAWRASPSALAAAGLDLVSAATAAVACLGNIGPGLGAVGPMSGYAGLHPASKAVLLLEMWVGRLEILPVVLLFSPELWRRLR